MDGPASTSQRAVSATGGGFKSFWIYVAISRLALCPESGQRHWHAQRENPANQNTALSREARAAVVRSRSL